MHSCGAFVFLAELFDEAAGHQVLQFFISPQPEHFLAPANGIAYLEVCKNALEKVIKTEYFLFSKDVAEFIGHMIRKTA